MPRQKGFFGRAPLPKGQNQGKAGELNSRKAAQATQSNQAQARAQGKRVRALKEFTKGWRNKEFKDMTKNEQTRYVEIVHFQLTKSLMGPKSNAVRQLRREYEKTGKCTGEDGR